MQDSKYQIAIFDNIEHNINNPNVGDLIVQATAGSGKTTTIVKASKLVPTYLDSIFLAFNKSIVAELRERLPDNVKCSTLHSLGMRSLYKFFTTKELKVSEYKTIGFLEKHLKDMKVSTKDAAKMKWIVSDIMNFARLNHVPNEQNLLEEVSDYYGVMFENKDMLVAQKVYDDIFEYNDKRVAERKTIDFVDMIYIPSFYEEAKLPKYDMVFVDESQDLNKSQQILVQKIKKPTGRAVFVGDENQAIYLFAGADANSFNSLSSSNTTKLPLSVCYRCAKSIVREAQKTIGAQNIEYFENQEEGKVTYGKWEDIKEGDMVVCRNNAPLFSLYFDLLGDGKKAIIKGKEIEKQLLNLVKKVRYSTVEEGKEKLESMLEKISEDLRKKGNPKPEKSKRFQNFKEMKNIIEFLSDDVDLMGEVKDKLEQIFDEGKEGVQLMTIHKSKGLESDTVHFLSPELIPSKWSETPEELEQEKNLFFVAQTRAKKHLNYIKNYQNRAE